MKRLKFYILVLVGVANFSLAAAALSAPDIAYAQDQNFVQVCDENGTGACANFVAKYINPFITLLTVVIGVAAAISIVVAGIQYASAGSDPGKVQKAKDRIGQTMLGLLAYILLFSFLNYIVPGGLF